MNSDQATLLRSGTRVEHERQWRLLADDDAEIDGKSIFLSKITQRLSTNKKIPEKISKALDFAFSIEYQHGTVPSRVYLNHPLRVAGILADEMETFDEETIAIGLLHNVLEVSNVSMHDLENVLGAQGAEAINALTVDRAQQYDPVYKNEYYARIERTSQACARVKIADKLDNIYMLCFNPSAEVRTIYLDEIDRWVIPMAQRVIPVLADLMTEASIAMRHTGFLDKQAELETARKMHSK